MTVSTVKAYISNDLTFAKVSKPCDEKYARKLIQNYLKGNTLYKGGWETLKNFSRWDDEDWYYFDISNIFAGKYWHHTELDEEIPQLNQFYPRKV